MSTDRKEFTVGPKRFKLGAVAVAATALFAAGCTDNKKEAATATSTTQQESAAKETANPTETKAADLRAGLTAQLQEHVYLAGITISQGVGQGLDSGEFKASAATLDQNSVALSKSIESVYGADAGKQFLALWRDHIGFFVNYAKGDKGAEKDLDGYRAEFGAFLAGANPNLTEMAVADELKPHVSSVIAVIDSLKAKDGKTFDLLRQAASHMPMTAGVLAGAIAKQYPDKFSAN